MDSFEVFKDPGKIKPAPETDPDPETKPLTDTGSKGSEAASEDQTKNDGGTIAPVVTPVEANPQKNNMPIIIGVVVGVLAIMIIAFIFLRRKET